MEPSHSSLIPKVKCRRHAGESRQLSEFRGDNAPRKSRPTLGPRDYEARYEILRFVARLTERLLSLIRRCAERATIRSARWRLQEMRATRDRRRRMRSQLSELPGLRRIRDLCAIFCGRARRVFDVIKFLRLFIVVSLASRPSLYRLFVIFWVLAKIHVD